MLSQPFINVRYNLQTLLSRIIPNHSSWIQMLVLQILVECNYCVTLQELLDAVYFTKHFRLMARTEIHITN